jgi:hypothetical protein
MCRIRLSKVFFLFNACSIGLNLCCLAGLPVICRIEFNLGCLAGLTDICRKGLNLDGGLACVLSVKDTVQSGLHG